MCGNYLDRLSFTMEFFMSKEEPFPGVWDQSKMWLNRKKVDGFDDEGHS